MKEKKTNMYYIYKVIIKLFRLLHILFLLDDEKFLKMYYYVLMKKRLNLKNPQTFNEKIQWLKLYDRKDIYTKMVDKYEAKKYAASIIGEQYIIPTLAIYNKWEEIDFDKLPNQFVIKCTHDSGGLCIVREQKKFNIEQAKKKINKCLKNNYFYNGREWPYKNVKPRIIIEKYMVDESGYELKDYKFFCFNGKVKLMFIATDRNSNNETCFDFYDENFNHLPFTNGHPNSKKQIKKPHNFEKMKELAEKLSKDIPQVRIDFYNINGKIYFGEITFFHWSGFVPFEPEEWDYKLGDLIDLSLVKKDEK